MKAVYFTEHGGPEKLIFGDLPAPEPARDEVLVKVKTCALNHLDIWVRNGMPAYSVKLPHVLGSDVSGEIAAVGPGVSGFSAGQRVIVAPGVSCWDCEWCFSGRDNLCRNYSILGAKLHGGYAELVKVKARDCIPLPDGLSFEDAAAFPLTFLTAWHMLITRARILPGQTILVLGAGSGVGVAAIQIAKLTGLHIIAVAGNDNKCEQAKQLGAGETINYSSEDFSRKARQLTGGEGVDVVFEHTGPDTWGKSLISLKTGGTLVTCGNTSGPIAQLDLRYLFGRELTVLGNRMGTKAELLAIVKLVGQGKLKPIIARIFPLKEAMEAHKYLESRQNFGKVVLKVS